MNSNDDPFLDICHAIETGLKAEYEKNPKLTDERCLFALDRAKIAVKQRFGFAANESCRVDPDLQGVVEGCVELAAQRVNDEHGPTLREFIARVDKIGRSVRRHGRGGNRSYYEFIREFLP